MSEAIESRVNVACPDGDMKLYRATHWKKNSDKTGRIYFLTLGFSIKVGDILETYCINSETRRGKVIHVEYDVANKVWEIQVETIG